MEVLQAMSLQQAAPKKLSSVKGKPLKYSEFTSVEKPATFLLNYMPAWHGLSACCAKRDTSVQQTFGSLGLFLKHPQGSLLSSSSPSIL